MRSYCYVLLDSRTDNIVSIYGCELRAHRNCDLYNHKCKCCRYKVIRRRLY